MSDRLSDSDGQAIRERVAVEAFQRARYERTRCSGMLVRSSCPPWDELSENGKAAWSDSITDDGLIAAVRSGREPTNDNEPPELASSPPGSSPEKPEESELCAVRWNRGCSQHVCRMLRDVPHGVHLCRCGELGDDVAEGPARCYDCLTPYGDDGFADLVVSDEAWRQG